MGNLSNPPATRSRTITINTGDPIPAALLDEIQDVIISDAVASGAVGPRWEYRFPSPAGNSSNVTLNTGNGFVACSSAPGLIQFIPMQSAVGRTVIGIGARIFGTGGGPSVVVTLFRSNSGAKAAVATLTIPTPAAAWTTYTATIAAHAIVDGASYWIDVELPTVTQACAAVGWRV